MGSPSIFKLMEILLANCPFSGESSHMWASLLDQQNPWPSKVGRLLETEFWDGVPPSHSKFFRFSILDVSKSPPIQCLILSQWILSNVKNSSVLSGLSFSRCANHHRIRRGSYWRGKASIGWIRYNNWNRFFGSYESVQTISLRMNLYGSKVSIEKQL